MYKIFIREKNKFLYNYTKTKTNYYLLPNYTVAFDPETDVCRTVALGDEAGNVV
jgi:hypothetical protein